MVKKLSLLVCCSCIAFVAFGQSTNSNIATEGFMKKMDMVFESKGVDFKLNDVQKLKLESIIRQREQKKIALNTQPMSKDQIASVFKSIDEEFQPQIEKVLTAEQLALFKNRMAVKQ
jgi:hypothetical protein